MFADTGILTERAHGQIYEFEAALMSRCLEMHTSALRPKVMA